jgi:phosphoserine phosphatase
VDADVLLPSWRPGTTRDAITRFLDDVRAVPVEERVACFDNDGTLWSERPTYIQYEFFVDALRRRVTSDAALAEREEFAAVLDGDVAQIGALGLDRVALALAGLFEGLTPEAFAAEARAYMDEATHACGRSMRTMVYRPMLELIDALRALDFTVAISTGGGREFVRAISETIYDTPAELVVGTGIDYDLVRDDDGRIELRRIAQVHGAVNEGAAKVANIQGSLGRRPILAAGNSAGDTEMLEWANLGPGPHLALLVDHDDASREYAYESRSETLAETEPITITATRERWTVVSMARDWTMVFT